MGLMVNFNEDSLLALAPLKREEKKKKKKKERKKERKNPIISYSRLPYKGDHNSNSRNMS